MIYIDELKKYVHKRKRYAHMIADSIEELHTFASFIELKRNRFHRELFCHYDVPEEMFKRIVESENVKNVNSRELVKIERKKHA